VSSTHGEGQAAATAGECLPTRGKLAHGEQEATSLAAGGRGASSADGGHSGRRRRAPLIRGKRWQRLGECRPSGASGADKGPMPMLPAALRDTLGEAVGTAGVVSGLASLSNRCETASSYWGTPSTSSVAHSTPWPRTALSRTCGVPQQRRGANLGLRLGGCACRDDRRCRRGWGCTLCLRSDWSSPD
jgi:hypothetical protein